MCAAKNKREGSVVVMSTKTQSVAQVLTIAIGADHRGFAHKEYLKKMAAPLGMHITWIDVGAFNSDRSDYPLFARAACQELLAGRAHRALLICGSGVGMAIAANRFKGIYAALVWNEEVARVSREDDNTNVLALPSDFVTVEQAVTIVQAWLKAEFRGGRYQERVAALDTLG